jgi:tetratricopeptide (TPR) repeat protein
MLLLLVTLLSCKEQQETTQDSTLANLEKAVEKAPNAENISQLLDAYNALIIDKETSRKELKSTLDKAYILLDNQKWEKELIGIISTYLREFPADKGNEEKILKLITFMDNRGQEATVEALKRSFVAAYQDSPERNNIISNLESPEITIDSFLILKAEKVFENPGEMGLNLLNAKEYVNVCEAAALILPSKLQTPRYLFNAAEISRTIHTFDKTLYLYDWIIDKYPQYEKAPMALFLKGFILENEVRNIDKAREVYRSFIEKYPSHDLADDVQFLLDNLGKSNEEILEMIEENKQAGK